MADFFTKLPGCFVDSATWMGLNKSPNGWLPWAMTLSQRTPASRAHLALCLAYIELYVNAQRTNDQAAIEANLNLALKAAQEALRKDPNSVRAHQVVINCQQGLDALRFQRPVSRINPRPRLVCGAPDASLRGSPGFRAQRVELIRTRKAPGSRE